MKITSKTLVTLFLILTSSILIGSLGWEVLERIVVFLTGKEGFTLSMKEPVQLFDFYVIAVSFRANPGSLIGCIAGLILFWRVK